MINYPFDVFWEGVVVEVVEVEQRAIAIKHLIIR